MLGKIMFVLLFGIVTLVPFEMAYQQISTMSLDKSQNFTDTYRGALKQAYDFRYVLYIGVILSLIFITFVPVIETQSEEEECNQEENVKEKPRKQTYLEYVKERLEAERLLRYN